jgi:hypothetical protein
MSKWKALRDGLRLIALIFRNKQVKNGVTVGEIADALEEDGAAVVQSVKRKRAALKAVPKRPRSSPGD